MMLRLESLLFVFFSAALLAASPISLPGTGSAPKFDWKRTKYMYAFGDSYTFVGGTKGYPKFR